ncbi:MAG: hypothetical protein CVT88_08920 [Candidatus Altiarchaeales archaeon HGW-Altiarchaeales-1]|nr:MAG: hypothetical protein CVT88_08920 [Candidatus Altiarchaeales archaeon HGW-Altiarchaeales-1]
MENKINAKSEWLGKHFKEIKEKYAGKYIAILNNKVISSGSTASDVLKELNDDELKKVEIIRIPSTNSVFY